MPSYVCQRFCFVALTVVGYNDGVNRQVEVVVQQKKVVRIKK